MLVGKGVLIGCAELIPSVSGGTIALLTGIWTEIVASLASFGPRTLRMLMRGEWASFWREHNMEFLLLVLIGSLIGLFTLASLVNWLIEHQLTALMALVFGVVLGSLPRLIGSLTGTGGRVHLPWLAGGMVIGLLVGLAPTGSVTAHPLVMFLSAMVASCAALLPGLSGAYILLLIGVYDEAVRAVAEFDFTMLVTISLGIGCGVFLFARLIHKLLSKRSAPILALLVGLVIGSLWKIAPTNLEMSAVWGLAEQPNLGLPIGTSLLLVLFGLGAGHLLSRGVADLQASST